MSALLTKQAGAGEGTDEQIEVYSARCPRCKWQSLWHSDPAKAAAALARHMAVKHG